MFAVLLVPPAPDLEQASDLLAQGLGGVAYDHRQTLLRNLPTLVGWSEEIDAPNALAESLRAVGVAAWTVGRSTLELAPEVRSAKMIAIGAPALAVAFKAGPPLRVSWSHVGLVMPCRAQRGSETQTATTISKVNIAALAAGLPISSKKTSVETDKVVEDRMFCLIWVREPDLLLHCERETMDYAGLGPEKTESSTTNYLLMLKKLEHAAPNAWEPRLEKAGSRIATLAGPSSRSSEQIGRKTTAETTRTSWDNSSAVEQAARLLILAARLRDVSER